LLRRAILMLMQRIPSRRLKRASSAGRTWFRSPRYLIRTPTSGKIMRSNVIALVLLAAVTGVARPQSAADSAAIRSTALDYVEGWYEGNSQRMARAVHPELVKRIVDVFGNAASAKAVMADWIDYMQLAKVNGRWVIVNVLWERKPGSKAN